jgi:hypothetical protein
MKRILILLLFSFLFFKAVAQDLFFPTLSPMMSTLYQIDSVNFRVSTDGGDSFGEWKSWPNKFIYAAFENADSSIVLANISDHSAAKYKYIRVKEFDAAERNIYYGARYQCRNENNIPFKIEFIYYPGIEGYQIITTPITSSSILSLKYFVKFDRYYKGKWIDVLLKKW